MHVGVCKQPAWTWSHSPKGQVELLLTPAFGKPPLGQGLAHLVFTATAEAEVFLAAFRQMTPEIHHEAISRGGRTEKAQILALFSCCSMSAIVLISMALTPSVHLQITLKQSLLTPSLA